MGWYFPAHVFVVWYGKASINRYISFPFGNEKALNLVTWLLPVSAFCRLPVEGFVVRLVCVETRYFSSTALSFLHALS